LPALTSLTANASPGGAGQAQPLASLADSVARLRSGPTFTLAAHLYSPDVIRGGHVTVVAGGFGHALDGSDSSRTYWNEVSVDGYETPSMPGVSRSVDIPAGCEVRIRSAAVGDDPLKLLVTFESDVTILLPYRVRDISRSLSSEAKTWAEEFLKADKPTVTCVEAAAADARAEVLRKGGKRERRRSQLTFRFPATEGGDAKAAFARMWSHVLREPCPL